MQITHASSIASIQPAAGKPADAVAAVPAATPASAAAQSNDDLSNLQLAREAVRQAAPDFDVARVADIKAALQRGEIRFDADKLAGLILAIHGRGR